MLENTIFDLVKEYSGCRSFESELEICCKIANHAGLTKPENSDDCCNVLRWVDTNFPDVYNQVTSKGRQFWSNVYPNIDFS